MLARMAAVRPPRALHTKRLFFRLSTTRFILRSDTLLSMATAPSEYVELVPVSQGVFDRLGHGMLGQQLLLPVKKLLAQPG